MTEGPVIRTGDCRGEMQEFPDDYFHAVVTDPPYNFEGGFMGEEWDAIGTNAEYQDWCEAWASEALRVMKPGGHLIAFSGSRTEHRLKAGVEDVGFEIRDTITWHYSSGRPKGSDISKDIDKMHRREFVKELSPEILADAGIPDPERTFHDWTVEEHSPCDRYWNQLKEHFDDADSIERDVIGTGMSGKTAMMGGLLGEERGGEYEITAAATDSAEQWSGWKSNLKPATEFAVLARKPLSEQPTYMNVLEHGTGAINASAAEITGGDRDRYPSNVVFSADVDDTPPKRYFYTSKASQAERTIHGQVENTHNTVKPLDLMEWLVVLVTASGQRVLDPFAGSGTTIMACNRLNREGIGIEKDDEYSELARKRVRLAHEVETDFSSTVSASDGQADLQSFADGA